MKASEIREKSEELNANMIALGDPEKVMFIFAASQAEMAIEAVAQLAEANEHLKRLAYPMQVVGKDGRIEDFTPTLRDQFAMSVMDAQENSRIDTEEFREQLAAECYAMADAMLEARKK